MNRDESTTTAARYLVVTTVILVITGLAALGAYCLTFLWDVGARYSHDVPLLTSDGFKTVVAGVLLALCMQGVVSLVSKLVRYRRRRMRVGA